LSFGKLIFISLDSIAIVAIGYWIISVYWTFYRVIQLGGTGWERKSPEDLISSGVGGNVYKKTDGVSDKEVATLLRPTDDDM